MNTIIIIVATFVFLALIRAFKQLHKDFCRMETAYNTARYAEEQWKVAYYSLQTNCVCKNIRIMYLEAQVDELAPIEFPGMDTSEYQNPFDGRGGRGALGLSLPDQAFAETLMFENQELFLYGTCQDDESVADRQN